MVGLFCCPEIITRLCLYSGCKNPLLENDAFTKLTPTVLATFLFLVMCPAKPMLHVDHGMHIRHCRSSHHNPVVLAVGNAPFKSQHLSNVACTSEVFFMNDFAQKCRNQEVEGTSKAIEVISINDCWLRMKKTEDCRPPKERLPARNRFSELIRNLFLPAVART